MGVGGWRKRARERGEYIIVTSSGRRTGARAGAGAVRLHWMRLDWIGHHTFVVCTIETQLSHAEEENYRLPIAHHHYYCYHYHAAMLSPPPPLPLPMCLLVLCSCQMLSEIKAGTDTPNSKLSKKRWYGHVAVTVDSGNRHL